MHDGLIYHEYTIHYNKSMDLHRNIFIWFVYWMFIWLIDGFYDNSATSGYILPKTWWISNSRVDDDAQFNKAAQLSFSMWWYVYVCNPTCIYTSHWDTSVSVVYACDLVRMDRLLSINSFKLQYIIIYW